MIKHRLLTTAAQIKGDTSLGFRLALGSIITDRPQCANLASAITAAHGRRRKQHVAIRRRIGL